MGVGKSPSANPEDAPALLDVSPPRKESSCLPAPPSSRLCHARGDIHVHLARQIPALPPCPTPGLPNRVKHPTVSELEIWCLAPAQLLTSDKPTLSSFPKQVPGVLVKIFHLHDCITSIQSFSPDLRDLDCGHSLCDRALQTPIQTLCCWFSLSRDAPRIPQARRNHPTCATVTENAGGFRSQTATKDSCASGFLPTTGCAAPHQLLSPVPALCSAEKEQNDGGTPGFLLFVSRWELPWLLPDLNTFTN